MSNNKIPGQNTRDSRETRDSRDSQSSRDSVEGLYALVTGGGSGIGLEIAKVLTLGGAHVTICGRTQEKLKNAVTYLDEQLNDAEVSSGSVKYVVADITKEAEIAQALGFAADPMGTLDILVANAGGSSHIGSILNADQAQVSETVSQNLIGTFLSIKHAVRYMSKSTNKAIVCITSGAGVFPHRFLWAYGMAKAGIESLVKSAAEEFGGLGVRVNSVAPGIIDDELMKPITSGGRLLDDYLEQIPLSRIGTVSDVALAAKFLVGPESKWVTGTCVLVDGGHHLRRGANYELLFS